MVLHRCTRHNDNRVNFVNENYGKMHSSTTFFINQEERMTRGLSTCIIVDEKIQDGNTVHRMETLPKSLESFPVSGARAIFVSAPVL